MIYLVSAENRRGFHHLLTEMHRQRKKVFIDALRWRLQQSAGLEIDAYDTVNALYLIEADTANSAPRASARLLPTTAPHLLGEHFAGLCSHVPPAGPHVWEATRFCPAPDTPAGPERRHMLARMIAAIMETGLIFGIDHILYVANAALAPLALKAGWSAEPLGPAQGKGRHKIQAFAADITAAGLRRVRERHAIAGPLVRYAPSDLAIAA